MLEHKRIIITDMDDTLIKAYEQPTPETRDFWNTLKESTVRIIATGQTVAKTMNNLSKSNMDLPEFIIADQGTVIYDTVNSRTIKEFVLPNDEVYEVLKQFYSLGGKDSFVRIGAGRVIIAYDFEQAHSFFERTFQKDVVYVENMEYVIQHGRYLKVILMGEEKLVDELVRFSSGRNNLFAFNTGKTSFGDCGFNRFEIMASDKYNAIKYLMDILGFEKFDVICLGDESSDLGLAKFALTMNLYENFKGTFAIISSNSHGNIQLKKECNELANVLGCSDKCKIYASITEDGWKAAVEEWLEQ